MMKNIVHIDLNAFFAQCEENKNPKLKNLPVAIGHNGKRGVVATSNYIARKYGVNSAMSIYQAKSLCPNLVIVEGNYKLYSDVSKSFMNFLKKSYPLIEVASIDEAYIDMTGFFNKEDAYRYLRNLQMDIYNNLHLKCSIGYSYNRFLAKMASDYNKPMGLTIVLEDDYKKLFWPLDIFKMYGIGKKSAPKLKQVGVNTIQDLALNDTKEVKEILGSSYSMFKKWANGQGDDTINTSSFNPKSISNMITLADNIDDPLYLKDVLKDLVSSVYGDLTYYNKLAKLVTITLRDSQFNTHSKRQSIQPTNNLENLIVHANDVFDNFYKGEEIRLIGFGIDVIDNKKEDTIDLFDQNIPSTNKIKKLINNLEKDYNLDNLKTLHSLKKDNKNENR